MQKQGGSLVIKNRVSPPSWNMFYRMLPGNGGSGITGVEYKLDFARPLRMQLKLFHEYFIMFRQLCLHPVESFRVLFITIKQNPKLLTVVVFDSDND